MTVQEEKNKSGCCQMAERQPVRQLARCQGSTVAALASHLVARHGVAEVRQWVWELWHEPNCSPCIMLFDLKQMNRQSN